jgi:hypothetical protein
LLQFVVGEADGTDGGEALLRVVIMLFEVFLDQGFEEGVAVAGESVLLQPSVPSSGATTGPSSKSPVLPSRQIQSRATSRTKSH